MESTDILIQVPWLGDRNMDRLSCKDNFREKNSGKTYFHVLQLKNILVQIQTGASKCVKFSGIANPGKTVSLIIRGSNKLMLEEAHR